MDRFDYSRLRREIPSWLLPLVGLVFLIVAWGAMGGEGPEIRNPNGITR